MASSVLLQACGSYENESRACRTRATPPRKETRPNARLMKLAIIPRTWSSPWQHPKPMRSELIDPFSAQSDGTT